MHTSRGGLRWLGSRHYCFSHNRNHFRAILFIFAVLSPQLCRLFLWLESRRRPRFQPVCLEIMKRLKFWLVTTAHLLDSLWFRDESDYKVGMNLVSVVAASSHALVIAFILMSNHVHLVLQGTYEECMLFITRFKKLFGQYFSHKYGSKELLRRNEVDLQELRYGDESLERAIAYVQMNSVAANICLNANEYPWGTGNAFFNPSLPKGTPVSEFSVRECRRLLHSAEMVPPYYCFLNEGIIAPSSYVQVSFVESLFRTPKRMNFFLQNSSKARRQTEFGEKDVPAFRDQVLTAAIQDLCRSSFHRTGILELNDAQKGELLRQLRYRFSANPNQLARVAGLSYEQVSSLLDAY